MIDNGADLAGFVALVRKAGWVAMDTEADSLHSYPEKLCLMQISIPAQDTLVDPLAGLDLGSLLEALQDKELIFHGCDYDLRMLYRTFRFVPTAVFDTMLAARLVGFDKFGLIDLTTKCLGVMFEKSSQKANWSMRPLTARMAAYARNDTRYLKPIADILRERLSALGRLTWHEQTCAQLIETCTRLEKAAPDNAWRISGSERMDRRGLGVLKELWHWRDLEAVAANRPPFFILSHDSLLALAKTAALGEPFDKLIPARYSDRRRASLHKAIAHARALPAAKLPEPLRARGKRMTAVQRQRLEALRKTRDHHARDLSLDPAVIASRATLCALACDWDTNRQDLLPWQRELLAPAVG